MKSIVADIAGFFRNVLAWVRWNLKGVRVTPDCRVNPAARLASTCSFFSGALVHDRARVGHFTYGTSCVIDNAHIGKFCSIAPGAKIGLNDHPVDGASTHPMTYDATAYNAELRPSIIGNDVWIGANAVILCGVTVPEGCVVAASAVVNRDLEPYSIVGGVPARVLGKRERNAAFSEAIAATDDAQQLRAIAAKYRAGNFGS